MKLAAVIRSPRRIYRRWRRENGNIMVTTALLMTVFMGMLALTIDIGFLAGQRRFMQNGADAGALAAARVMAGSVSPYSSSVKPNPAFPNFFTASDAQVRNAATTIAGQNQNAGLTGRTTAFAAVLQYCVASGPTRYDFTAANDNCQAAGNSWVTSPTTNGKIPDGAYKVRVTTSSTITTLFGQAAGGASQTATSANAIAYIQGVCPVTTVSGKAWPFTAWDRQDFGTTYNTLFQFWGSSNPPSPINSGNSWQNVLDLTPPDRWCDNNASYPDYKWRFPAMVPSGTACNYPNPAVVGSTSFTGTDSSWNRAGYTQDPRSCYVGNVQSSPDLANWAVFGYGGTLRAASLDASGLPIKGSGNKMPTYIDANPAQGGNGGANVAQGIYGSPTTPSCSGGTFFFSTPDGARDPNPDFAAWGPYKDVLVITYDWPESWDTKSNTWATSKNGDTAGRVELSRIFNFRIYRDYDSANSRIWGRIISPVSPPSSAGGCGTGPGFNGNVVRMGN